MRACGESPWIPCHGRYLSLRQWQITCFWCVVAEMLASNAVYYGIGSSRIIQPTTWSPRNIFVSHRSASKREDNAYQNQNPKRSTCLHTAPVPEGPRGMALVRARYRSLCGPPKRRGCIIRRKWPIVPTVPLIVQTVSARVPLVTVSPTYRTLGAAAETVRGAGDTAGAAGHTPTVSPAVSTVSPTVPIVPPLPTLLQVLTIASEE